MPSTGVTWRGVITAGETGPVACALLRLSSIARVRSAWPKSPLGEDALLRQAEAASKLGDFAAAARIAEQYEHDYPNGRRRAEVRRYARLP